MKRIHLVGLLVLCALTFLAVGCGGDDDEPSSADAPAAVTTTDTPTEEESSDDSGGATEDCKEFQEAASQVGQQFSTALSGTGDANVQEAAQLFDDLTSRAPEEIQDDFEVINDAFQKLAEALEGVDLSGGQTPDQETLQKLQQLSTEIDQARLTQASTNISTWAQQNCQG